MCGILGGWHHGNSFSENTIHSALNEMHHRGPDDRGYEIFNIRNESILMLGHTRLSILDLSEAGHQPMSSSNNRFNIVFNGEIYNYKELRNKLKQQGCKFYSGTDTEVLLSAWEFWGADCLNMLTGMFAFTVFDKKLNTLTSVRDGFGIKPFYYAIKDGSYFFASELNALFSLSNYKKEICNQKAYDYLVRGEYDNDELSFFDGIKHLLPGSLIEFNLNSGKIERIEKWHVFETREVENLSFGQAAEALRFQFLENINLHLRSDVPLGAALSGGIDSSAVVCAMRYLNPHTEINTFSYIAKGSPVSEEYWIDLVNDHVSANANKVIADSKDFIEDIDTLINLQGEPFGSTSIYASYRVFRLAKEKGITVTLDGQGADELLAGYRGYPIERMKSFIDTNDLRGLLYFVKNWSNWPGRSFSDSLKCLGYSIAPKHLSHTLENLFLRDRTPSWLDKNFLSDIDANANFKIDGKTSEFHGRNVINRLVTSLQQNGIPQLLRHADRNSMEFSVESRVPFLTKSMADMTLTLPEKYLISNEGETKSVFREAMRDIVPDMILDRRDKIGFLTPEKQWLHENSLFFRDYLIQGINSPIFNQPTLIKEFDRCIENVQSSKDIWRWINFVRWCQLNNM
jgi:asparagine synthase (glutamine-hydrolysing)